MHPGQADFSSLFYQGYALFCKTFFMVIVSDSQEYLVLRYCWIGSSVRHHHFSPLDELLHWRNIEGSAGETLQTTLWYTRFIVLLSFV